MFCIKCQAFWQEAISKAQFSAHPSSAEDVRWSRHETILHRSMRELKDASESHCRVCRAILFSPTRFEKPSLLSDDDELLHIVLELEQRNGPYPVFSASFLSPNVSDGSTTIRIPKRIIATSAGFLTDNGLASTLDRSMSMDNSSTGSDAALELAAFWMNRCLSKHSDCRVNENSGSKPFVPTRLIDVQGGIRLVETRRETQYSADRKYVALSHCWGKISIITTIEENYDRHTSYIDPKDLSKTFNDAVHTTRKLGLRYLWIDSLCIIQDSGEDWAAEAATMCDVYRNAVLTIAAAHAPGGNVGCFEDRDGLLQFPFILDIPIPEEARRDTYRHLRMLFTSYGRIGDVGKPEPPLYGRAWVLQEQLLSPRMLVFDGPQIRWECLSMHGSERTPQGGISRHIGHQKSIRTGIMQDAEFFHLPNFDSREFGELSKHQDWCYTVMDYTHRGMTKAFDRLAAIDGIAQALSRKTTQTYLAGLWSKHFWLGMLWSISHRNEFTPTVPDAFVLEDNPHVRHVEPIAPSWSWVSVTVPVVYPVPTIVYLNRICEVITTTTHGSATKRTGAAELRVHARTGFVNAIYPFAIREAAHATPSMVSPKPDGRRALMTYGQRVFSPSDFFIFSPASGNKRKRISTADWMFVRGTWRPDEVLDPQAEITFIAIAQQNSGSKEGSLINTHRESDPLKVYGIGLVPTGNAMNEYRRVGYAIWEDCAWYGYMCGEKSRDGRHMEKAKGWRSMFMGNDIEKTVRREVDGRGQHEHRFKVDSLPDASIYHENSGMSEIIITIV
ncbi:HET-domain-containing protein, partial [Corynespora cassiicola Philippines]